MLFLTVFYLALILNLLYISKNHRFLISIEIYLILAHGKTLIFLTLTSDSPLLIILLVDKTVFLMTNVSLLAIFFILIICANRSFIISSFFILYLHLVCKFSRFGEQINTQIYNYKSFLISVNFRIIYICLQTTVPFYYWVYFPFPIIFSSFLTFLILCSSILGIKRYNVTVLLP